MPPTQKHAAPTPVYLKKRLYPLPAVLTNIPLAVAATALKASASVAGTEKSSAFRGFVHKGRAGPVVNNKEGDTEVILNRHFSATRPRSQTTATHQSSSVKTLSNMARTRNSGGAESSTGTLPLVADNGNYFGKPRVSRTRTDHPTNMGNSYSVAMGRDLQPNGNDLNDNFESWTLKVSKFDILKLKHELDGEEVKERMKQFENQYLKRSSSS